MKKFIIHIGFARTGSTSLQRMFDNTDLSYLGFSKKWSPCFYKNRKLSFFFEQVLRFGTNKSFDDTAPYVKQYLIDFLNKSKKDVALSNENIIGRTIPYDLPNDIKISRVLSVLPNKSVVIISIRNIQDLLLSLYKLHLQNGYGENEKYFFDEILSIDKSFGFLESFRIKLITNQIVNERPDLLIKVVDLSNKNSMDKMKKFMNLTQSDRNLNISPNFNNLSKHLVINKCLFSGKRLLDWLEIHRVAPTSKFHDDSKYRLSRSRHLNNLIDKLFINDNIKFSLIKSFHNSVPKQVIKISIENKKIMKKYSL